MDSEDEYMQRDDGGHANKWSFGQQLMEQKQKKIADAEFNIGEDGEEKVEEKPYLE